MSAGADRSKLLGPLLKDTLGDNYYALPNPLRGWFDRTAYDPDLGFSTVQPTVSSTCESPTTAPSVPETPLSSPATPTALPTSPSTGPLSAGFTTLTHDQTPLHGGWRVGQPEVLQVAGIHLHKLKAGVQVGVGQARLGFKENHQIRGVQRTSANARPDWPPLLPRNRRKGSGDGRPSV